MNSRIKNARNDGDGVKGAEKKEDHTWHKDDQLQHVTSEVACFHRLVRVMPLKCQTCSIPQRALSMVNRGRGGGDAGRTNWPEEKNKISVLERISPAIMIK